MEIYIVMHYMGMDGSYEVAAFTKEEEANKLCDLYKATEEYGDYDYYSTRIDIDKYNINGFELKDGILLYSGEEF
jgi:hypothetical protein